MPRSAAGPARAPVAIVAAMIVVACGSGPGGAGLSTSSPAETGASPTAPTDVPGSTTTVATPGRSVPTTTKTPWGTIWDDLPVRFPRYPGAEPADSGEGPVSATLAIPATARAAADWYEKALVDAGYDVEAASGPLENGALVLDLNGRSPTCRLQVSLVPQGNQAIGTILFGADCSFG